MRNEVEDSQNERRSRVFPNNDRNRSCKYKVVFKNNVTTREAYSMPVSKQSSIKINSDDIHAKRVDLRYINGSTETYSNNRTN